MRLSGREVGGEARVDPWSQAWERAAAGAVAVVDCGERIPCNPCEEACARGAIEVGEDICAPPRFDAGLCDGCGRCVAMCPGMAIFLLDRSAGNGRARVTVPYEMGEEMRAGREVWAMDGEGKPLGKARVVGAKKRGGRAGTTLVTVEVDEGWALKVRGVRDRLITLEAPLEAEAEPLKEYPLCRCEEVSGSRVEEVAVEFASLRSLRRFSRVGLGYCQGRFCQDMLRERLAGAREMGEGEVGTFRARPPVRPVKLGKLGGEDA